VEEVLGKLEILQTRIAHFVPWRMLLLSIVGEVATLVDIIFVLVLLMEAGGCCLKLGSLSE